MHKTHALGIDPGKAGAIVFGEIDEKKTTVLEVIMMPTKRRHPSKPKDKKLDIDWIRLAEKLGPISQCCDYVFIEAVPTFCGVELSASTMSVLFRNVGFLEGVVLASDRDPDSLVRLAPLRWMNLVSEDSTRSRLRAERKPQLRSLASTMFPDYPWDLDTCDAVLILEAGRRMLYN